MANNDMMNVSATDEMKTEDNSNANADRVGKGIATRAENRLKRAFAEFGKAVAAFLAPVKKFITIGIIIVVIVFVVIIILAAAYKYLLEIDAIDADDKKTEIVNKSNSLTTGHLYGYKGQTSDGKTKKIESLDNFLFIGDSRYAGKDFGTNTKNLGVGSAKIDEWLNVAENGGTGYVKGKYVDITGQYTGISIQLGANSVGDDVNTAVGQMVDLICNLQNLHKNTPIFVNSCVQVHPKANNNDYDWNPEDYKNRINEFNEAIEEYCDTQSNVYYININYNLNDNYGYLKTEYTDDGLHCNDVGLGIFIDNIRTAITSLEVSSNSSQSGEIGERTEEKITIDKNDDGEYCILTNLDKKVDQIYDGLKEDRNILLKMFDSEKDAKKSIKLWIIAEYSTQYVNLGSDVKNYKHDYDADYVQGNIKVKRYGVDENGQETSKYMTFKTPEEFEKLKLQYEETHAQEDLDELLYHFTIDTQDNLIIARYETEIKKSKWINEDTKVQIPEEDNDEKYQIIEKPVPYRTAILPYTMPYFLFVTLTMYGEDAEFTNDIAKLAIDSEMVIGIRDNVITEVTTIEDTYLREEKTREYAKVQAQALGVTEEAYGTFFKYIVSPLQTVVESRGTVKEFASNEDNTKLKDVSEIPCYEKETVITRISDNVSMNIEYIDGWCFNHKITYRTKVRDILDEDINYVTNTGYQTTKSEEDGEIVNETDPQKIQVAVDNNENLKTIYDEAVNKIKSDEESIKNILSEHYNRKYEYISRYAESDNVYKVLDNIDNLVELIITGGDPDYASMNQEYFESIGIDFDEESDISIEEQVNQLIVDVDKAYVELYNDTIIEEPRENVIDDAISRKIVKFTTEKQERIVNRTVTTTVNTNKKMNIKVSTKTKERTGKSGNNFVSILCKPKYQKVKNNLTGSTASWFFDTLEKREETAGMVELLKYLFYKATNNDYGVTKFDFNFRFRGHMNGMYSGGFKAALDFIHIWENSVLYYYSLGMNDGGEYVAEGEDGNMYYTVLWGGSGDPTMNLTYGIVISRPYNDDYFQEYGITVEELRSFKPGDHGKPFELLTMEEVDEIGVKIVRDAMDKIREQTAGLDLTEPQIAALVSIKYQYGNIGNFVDAYNEYYAKGKYEEFRKNFRDIAGYNPLDIDSGNNKETGVNGIVPSRRVKANWTAFHEGIYTDGNGNEMEMYYDSGTYNDGEFITVPENAIIGRFNTVNGRTFTFYHQMNIPGWGGYCNKASAASILSAYRDSEQSEMDIAYEMEELSVLVDEERTMQKFAQYGLTATNTNFNRQLMLSTLSSGGYVAVHFNVSDKTKGPLVSSKSKFTYSSNNMHWIAVVGYRVLDDGREQMLVANPGWINANGWVDVDDFEEFDGYIDNFWYIMEDL